MNRDPQLTGPLRPLPDAVIEVYKRDVDVSLLIENLKMTVEERLLAMIGLHELVEEMRRGLAGSRPAK